MSSGPKSLYRVPQRRASEVSTRPHDTGLVTLVSQDLSEFALHARAILGLPIPEIRQNGPAASCAVLLEGESRDVVFPGVERALEEPGTQLRLFGKPEVKGRRRMGVTLALGGNVEQARDKARRAATALVAAAEMRRTPRSAAARPSLTYLIV